MSYLRQSEKTQRDYLQRDSPFLIGSQKTKLYQVKYYLFQDVENSIFFNSSSVIPIALIKTDTRRPLRK